MWRMFLPNYFPGKSAWEQVGAARSRFKKFTSQVVLSGSVLRLKDAFTFNLKWVGFFFFCWRIWIFRCAKTQGRAVFKIKLMHAHYRRAHLHFRCFIYLDLHAWNSYRCPLFTASPVSTKLHDGLILWMTKYRSWAEQSQHTNHHHPPTRSAWSY